MKIETYQFPKSSFLAVEKDSAIITNWMLKNDRLKKMLYYTTPDALKRPNLNEDQSFELFQQSIKWVPKVKVDDKVKNYVVLYFTDWTTNATNPAFRDNTILFNILCHMDNWILTDYQMRPYRIAAEIDTMFNQKHLSGIGKLEFMSAATFVENDEFAGVALAYRAVHDGDDTKNMINPTDQEQYNLDFDKLFNGK